MPWFENIMPASDDHPFWRWLLDRRVGDATPPRFRAFGDNLRNFAVAGLVLKGSQAILAGKPGWYYSLAGRVVGGVGTLFIGFCALQLFGLGDLLVFSVMSRTRLSGRKRLLLRLTLLRLNAIVPTLFVTGLDRIVYPRA